MKAAGGSTLAVGLPFKTKHVHHGTIEPETNSFKVCQGLSPYLRTNLFVLRVSPLNGSNYWRVSFPRKNKR